MNDKFKNLRNEDIIWFIYIFIAIFAIVSNKLERNYYKYKKLSDYKKYKTINIIIFIIAIIIYLYFIKLDLSSQRKNEDHYLHLFAATLFFIGGVIYLYLECKSTSDIELEIN